MKSNERILILTASYGDGHIQAARSLKHSFERRGILQVQIMDLMKEAHPLLDKVTKTLYINSMLISQYGLDYYGWSYYFTKDAEFHVGWGRYLNNLGQNKLRQTIQQMRPCAVISTFPFGAVPELCRQLGIPTFAVVTDFTLHARWKHPDIDKYYVAAYELKEQLMASSISSDRIEVSGIPIRKAFYESGRMDSSPFSSLTNNHRKTILILAGSYGVLRSNDEIIDVVKNVTDSQVAVVCGRNRKLEHKLRLKYEGEPNVHIYGFVDNIHQLMMISSCIITKAGGLTLSEVLCLQVPIFIYKPFAGQEKENAAFFSKKSAAYVSRNMKEMAFQIERFFSDPHYAVEMKRQMQLLHKEAADDFITQDILSSIKQPQMVLQ
ncbi:MGDG synthase family glycosyltransferase [Paenibacillus planticolens]|uniref:Glycosyltransferase n=1 Tax=Paenibacillus planticolens TaxID=2654976 RepID=A0ABX1ZV24_9BACL|nr:glycosyltransferase [Paenibacillus planticolens]NOV03698.1 glycosyltransferase [Paenibacillus planticolens]